MKRYPAGNTRGKFKNRARRTSRINLAMPRRGGIRL